MGKRRTRRSKGNWATEDRKLAIEQSCAQRCPAIEQHVLSGQRDQALQEIQRRIDDEAMARPGGSETANKLREEYRATLDYYVQQSRDKSAQAAEQMISDQQRVASSIAADHSGDSDRSGCHRRVIIALASRQFSFNARLAALHLHNFAAHNRAAFLKSVISLEAGT